MKILVAERLKELMKESGVTQYALAKAIGMRQSNVSEWLSQKKEPSIKSLWLLADFFLTWTSIFSSDAKIIDNSEHSGGGAHMRAPRFIYIK